VNGNDREIFTFDAAGTTFYGRVEAIHAGGVTFDTVGTDPGGVSFLPDAHGAALMVATGRGAGQYRRIVSFELSLNATNGRLSHWTIDKPFAIAPDPDALIQVMPFRGRTIHYNSKYEDGGSFQFTQIGIENLVYGVTMERTDGMVSFGQWRGGWESGFGGPGNFINPNVLTQFIGNEVLEGLRASHQATQLGQHTFGDKVMFQGNGLGIVNAWVGMRDIGVPGDIHTGCHNSTPEVECVGQNRLITLRRNKMHSNAGILVGPSIDCLIEGNTVLQTPASSIAHYAAQDGISVSPLARAVMLRNN
jgi:hypothetical protein